MDVEVIGLKKWVFKFDYRTVTHSEKGKEKCDKRRWIMKNYVNPKCADAHELLKKEKFETNGLIRIMTREETAEILRVHPSTVSRYAKSGELPSFKLGSRRLFKYEDLVVFFENQADREYVFGKEL